MELNPIDTGVPLEALSFDRNKPRSFLISAAYRVNRIARAMFGRRQVLRAHLLLAWLFHRLAHEASIEVYGNRYRLHTLGLRPDNIGDWIPQGGSVLDVGCGVGRWSHALVEHASEVVGIDYDERSIRIARENNTAPNVLFVVGDATRPLESAIGGRHFDIALLLHIIEHVEDVYSLLTDLKSVARRLVVEVPDFDSNPLNTIRRLEGLPFYSDADHVREYTPELLTAQLDGAGWTIDRMERRGGVILASAANLI